MAMIICPECGKKFSEFASSCPNCGYPTSKIKSDSKKVHVEPETKRTEWYYNIRLNREFLLSRRGIPGIISVLLFACCWYLGCKYNEPYSGTETHLKYLLVVDSIRDGLLFFLLLRPFMLITYVWNLFDNDTSFWSWFLTYKYTSLGEKLSRWFFVIFSTIFLIWLIWEPSVFDFDEVHVPFSLSVTALIVYTYVSEIFYYWQDYKRYNTK